jgi:hypothetical protein
MAIKIFSIQLFLKVFLITANIIQVSGQAIKKSYNQEKKDSAVMLLSFDNDIPGFAINSVTNSHDSIYGRYEYVKGIKGKALSFDGFRTFIKTKGIDQQSLQNEFTVEAWIAPAMYPWSESPVFDCSDQQMRGFFFGIDELGRVVFKVAAGNTWYETRSETTIPLRKWSHIAGVFKADNQLSVFINGENVASIPVSGLYVPPLRNFPSTIGRNNRPLVWHEKQLTTPETWFFLDGLLDEVMVSARVKTGDEINKSISDFGNFPEPVLSERGNFPKGPIGSGSFGAFYTKLDYYKEWDEMWRVGDKPDVFVRFDDSPVQLVFWRGTSFVPCWVSENDIWYTNEWLETWGSDVASCAEPIMDRDARYSHVRIIENTDARVVVHWRYALADAFYNFAAISDDGRGEWCDEFHIIYPDHVGVRRMELHYSKPERKHDWVEQIVLTAPGQYPADLIEKESITLVNMKGESKKYLWHENLDIQMPEPKGANISFVNLKSEYKPFFVIPPDPVNTVEGKWDSPFFRTYAANQAQAGFRPNPAPTVYGWWNHWPVAQIPGDGRWVVTPDKPGHFNLTTFVQWNDLSKTDKTRTRIMLQGMTDSKAEDLVPLAKSWLQAPDMIISSDGFKGEKYDEAERAFILEKSIGNNTSLNLIIKASEESPLVNPAFIIKNWGNHLSAINVDGKNLVQGKDFKQGISKTSDGDDLILWLRLNRKDKVEITVDR